MNIGFTEQDDVVLEVAVAAPCTLLVDDAPLEPVAGAPGCWRWKPGFYAGEVRAELVDAAFTRLGSWRLDVSPSPDKLGSAVFDGMVAELMDFDPTLVLGQEPARTRMGALGRHQGPLVALMRLRSREHAVRKALEAIVREPIRTLRARRALVAPHAVRRPDHYTALAVLREPVLLQVLAGGDDDDDAAPAAELRVDVPDVERRLDGAANRCALAMLQALVRRCVDVRRRLARRVHDERASETVTPLAERWGTWSRVLDRMERRLRALRRRPPFCEVTRAEITAAGLNAVSAHPLYAHFWRLAWESLRQGLEGARDDPLPMSPTWEIYERWCFLRLLRLLQNGLPTVDWKPAGARSWGATRCWEGRHPGGTTFHFLLQPRFGSTNGAAREGFWSVSRARDPDIVLHRRRGAQRDFLVLDAKYRASRPNVLDAMASAHVYQDSLRCGAERPRASVLLVPTAAAVPWLEERSFVTTHRTGVASLEAEGDAPAWLCELLLAV